MPDSFVALAGRSTEGREPEPQAPSPMTSAPKTAALDAFLLTTCLRRRFRQRMKEVVILSCSPCRNLIRSASVRVDRCRASAARSVGSATPDHRYRKGMDAFFEFEWLAAGMEHDATNELFTELVSEPNEMFGVGPIRG